MTARFDLRRGNNLELDFEVTEGGSAVTVTSWTVTCALADRYGEFSANLTVSLATNVITVTANAATTAEWPVGVLRGKLTMVVGSDTLSSDTFEIEVLP